MALRTSLSLTLQHSTMALLHSTSLYWGSESHSTMAILCTWLSFYYGSTLHYITLQWLYFTLFDCTWFCHYSAWLYISLQWLYFTLLHSTLFYSM